MPFRAAWQQGILKNLERIYSSNGELTVRAHARAIGAKLDVM
jgi:hypothetical protein